MSRMYQKHKSRVTLRISMKEGISTEPWEEYRHISDITMSVLRLKRRYSWDWIHHSHVTSLSIQENFCQGVLLQFLKWWKDWMNPLRKVLAAQVMPKPPIMWKLGMPWENLRNFLWVWFYLSTIIKKSVKLNLCAQLLFIRRCIRFLNQRTFVWWTFLRLCVCYLCQRWTTQVATSGRYTFP